MLRNKLFLFSGAIALSLVGPLASARGHSHGSHHHTHSSSSSAYDDRLMESGSYINSDGRAVHRPAHTLSGNHPHGASAQCRDGTYSFSQHHRGTCSHHGGVSQWSP